MTTISVCMIIKNEQNSLPRILAQVSEFADEIVVVDTGSNDDSINIAKKYTDKVYEMTFIDFATCRNYSLSKASSDFLMWLDADDFLPQNSISALLNLKKNLDDYDMIMMPYQTAFDESGKATFEYYRERIFRNNHGYYFEGAVHEAICPSGKIAYMDIPVIHHKTKPNTPLRNLNIYQNMIAMGKQLSARELFYYANELYANNMSFQALAIYSQVQARNDVFLPNLVQSCINSSNILLDYGEYEQAFYQASKCLSYDLPTPTVYCQIGYVLHKWQKYTLSNYYYELATHCNPENPLGFVNKDCQDFIPYIQIALNYYLQKDYAKAIEYNAKALISKPYSSLALANDKIYREALQNLKS